MIAVSPHPSLAFLPLDRRELAACLGRMLRRLGPPWSATTWSLELACVHDADMIRLNSACMGCPGPTNMLAFPSGGTPPDTLGSLVLSADTLRREARLYGQEPEAYCRRLLAHGLAHLLGYDHGPDMDTVCDRMLEGGTPDGEN